jgi:TM2 domain-containing membrane protein YozV
MKRIIIALIAFLMFSGVGFAAFQVQTSQEDVVTVAASNGTSAQQAPAATNASDGTVAIVLALVSVLLLPFGLHNWYLGRKKQALWQTLLVFPGFILIIPALVSWVWQVIDLIRLLGSGGTL